MINLEPVTESVNLKLYADMLGTPLVDLRGNNYETVGKIYADLLTGVYVAHLARNCKSDEEVEKFCMDNHTKIADRINAMMKWLNGTDFFEAPASTKYHDSCKGGLVYHSLRVYNQIVNLANLPAFNGVDIISACLVALVHDWCKIHYYDSYTKNVKDDQTGQWHQELAYTVDQKGVPLGHGVSSMFLAQKFFNLATDEALAIRWHMGRWNACEIELSELQNANSKVPLVYMLQFADQLACTAYC